MAAVLALGPGAALSHRSAAELWRMLQPNGGPVHVVVPGIGGRGRRQGIRLHRCSSLPSSAVTEELRIRVTSPARTIRDLRRTASVDDVRRAIRAAQFRGLALGDEATRETELTRSELERRFLSLCRRYRLPRPEVNTRVGRFEVDFLWREKRLIVETDGWRAHGTRWSFEEDRARDVQLQLLGFHVLRFTYRQVLEEPAAVAATLRELLLSPAP